MIKTKILNCETWKDFESLMSTDAQCSECWCLNHREPAGCPTGDAAREKMKLLAENQRTYGLLAYSEEVCVGWIAVDPVSDLVGHDLQATGKEHEWSIHCIFVREGYRGKGLSTQLIQAAVEYARAKGAKIISAFPIPSENRKRFPENEAEFSGRLSTYQKLGFTYSGPSTDFYQRMELE